jgi:hypothetical protein
MAVRSFNPLAGPLGIYSLVTDLSLTSSILRNPETCSEVGRPTDIPDEHVDDADTKALGPPVELGATHKYLFSPMLADRLVVGESVLHPSRCHYFREIDLASSASPCNPELREYGYLQGQICSRLLRAGVQW